MSKTIDIDENRYYMLCKMERDYASLTAELEQSNNAIDNIKVELYDRTTEIEAAKAELSGITGELEQVKADNAVLIQWMENVLREFENPNIPLEKTIRKIVIDLNCMLSDPYPGAPLLDELAKLRKVRDAAREFFKSCNIEIHEDPLNSWWELKQALAEAESEGK